MRPSSAEYMFDLCALYKCKQCHQMYTHQYTDLGVWVREMCAYAFVCMCSTFSMRHACTALYMRVAFNVKQEKNELEIDRQAMHVSVKDHTFQFDIRFL